MESKRYAIVGTAPSWKKTPFSDPNLVIASLNDAYRMKGFVRADEWFDFHPLNRFWHPPADRPIYAHEVPPGYYARPLKHLEWLGTQATTIPVYLHPQYREQYPAAAAWVNARPIPRDEIEAHYGRYFMSSPAEMLALAVMRGFRDVAIYGIHLSTEHEYIEQRPNFEFLCGRVLGPGKIRMTEADGMRHYETEDGHLALPVESPLLHSSWRYAVDTRPRAHLEPIKWELHKLQIKAQRYQNALLQRATFNPWVTVEEPTAPGEPLVKRRLSTRAVQDRLAYVQAQMADWQQQAQRLSLAGG